jgi:hypothetical protein
MNKTNKLVKRPLLFLALAPFLMATGAMASTSIQSKAIALQVIPAPTKTPIDRNCLACHTTGQAKADVVNLKPGYQAAYKANKTTLANLKTLLNVLPTTTVGLTNSGLAKTDIYEVICAPGGLSLESSVKDLAPVKLPVVSTQVTKGTLLSPLGNDTVDGDAIYSKATKLLGGPGAIYSVKINKSAYTGTVATHKGPESYTGQLACRNTTGALTGLAWRIIQNQ